MKQCLSALVILFALGGQATAQATTAYVVATFPSSATNPATAVPLAQPVTYPVAQIVCNQPKVGETLPIVNPYEGRFDDPADAARDCVVPIEPQFKALPVGTGYKAAYRAQTSTGAGTWSTFSTTFAVTAGVQTHPCDGTPPTTGTILAGARTLDWCWNGLDANGATTTVTTWTATVDGARVVLSPVTVGATANAQGKRLYSAPLTVAAGTRLIRVAGTNTVGEAVFSATFTATVTLPPAAVPSVAEIRGIR